MNNLVVPSLTSPNSSNKAVELSPEEISVSKARCRFCLIGRANQVDPVMEAGKMYKIGGIVVHYFCVLFRSGNVTNYRTPKPEFIAISIFLCFSANPLRAGSTTKASLAFVSPTSGWAWRRPPDTSAPSVTWPGHRSRALARFAGRKRRGESGEYTFWTLLITNPPKPDYPSFQVPLHLRHRQR